MNILIIDTWGAALDFSLRAQEYGHTIRWYVDKVDKGPDKGKYNQIGTGLVPRIRSWSREDMLWADLIFLTDNTKHLKEIQPYFMQGFPIFGPTWEAAQLELNRGVGNEAFKKAGIKVIPSTSFSSYAKAIAFVKETKKRYVSKPNGDADKALSYVSKNPADLIYMLEKWEQRNKLKDSFILQEFRAGIEMGVSGFFGPHGFSDIFAENWEFKKLMNDDKGPATGEQGTIIRYTKKSKLAEMVLLPLETLLHRVNYVGDVDINCIIDKEGTPWPLEFTNRPGWPSFQIQQALHKGDPAKWMLDLVNGKDTLQVKEDVVACGVVLSLPDYPYYNLSSSEVRGIPIYGITESNISHMHPSDVMLGNAPTMVNGDVKTKQCWVANGPYLMTVTGTGTTVSESRKAAYKNVDQIDIPGSIMYRTDIGCRLEKQLPELHSLGFAKGLSYGYS